MLSLNDIAFSEISYGAGYLQYAVVSTGAEAQLLDSYFQKPIGTVLYLAVLLDLPSIADSQ